jgi:small subunit ribosomal protein S1
MSSTAASAWSEQTDENFGDLFKEFIQYSETREGSVAVGTVLRIEKDNVIVEVPGLKSEGRVALREFALLQAKGELQPGDEVEIYVERFENSHGETVLSFEKALREKAWEKLEKASESGQRVQGTIFGRVKGGFTVDLGGAVAFLPGSQVDIRPVRDIDPLMGIAQPFVILKMDRRRGNIVVSRRAILEESRQEARKEILQNILEGQVMEGIVKNITDYGAFIDLGGVDGLLHVTDISWKRINHPSEMLALGQTVKVMVTKYNQENQRISLGMKQLESNPWDNIEDRFPTGLKMRGTVTNITDYGAFVDLGDGIEGLVHVSEMSWTKKNIHPGKIVSTSQEVDVIVLAVEPAKHRISLGMKQCEANPWEAFAKNHKEGDIVEGEVRNTADFGVFIALDGGIEGLVHSSDISWEQSGEEAMKAFKRGDMVKAKVLEIDVEKERVGLGIKQLTENKSGNVSTSSGSDVKKGATITCTVTAVSDDGIEVDANGSKGFIKRSDLSRDRSEQRPERFAAGDRVDANVTTVDKKSGKLTLSIKALEMDEEKRAVAEYGSTDSGASLGDILGAALNKASEEQGKPKKAAKKSAE